MRSNFADPGISVAEDIWLSSNVEHYEKLPDTLAESLRCLGCSKFARSALGDKLISGFIKIKRKEVDIYMTKITDWEREYYLDC